MKRPARVGIFAVLAVAIAVAAGYLNNCFTGLGFGPGQGAGQLEATKDVAKDAARDVTKIDPTGKVRVVVQGEHCRMEGDKATQSCEDLCKEIVASAADVEATAGTQGTVDRFKSCLQARGIKVQVLSE
ncbi:MAG: hypothetical protein H0T76_12735 [Nannocystis sp.]|nr:hypothetical protein [Nannocystis sp.]MBA3547345.1 hypothetical protein [Nannocystis sp.]